MPRASVSRHYEGFRVLRLQPARPAAGGTDSRRRPCCCSVPAPTLPGVVTRSASDGTLSVAADQDSCQDRAPSPSRSVARNEPPSKRGRVSIRLRIGTSFARRSSSWPPPAWATTSSHLASVFSVKSSANGVSASSTNVWLAWTKSHEAGGKPAFPPSVVVEIKRLACESPRTAGVPLARWSLRELQREVRHARGRRHDQRHDRVALARRRCDPAVAPSQLAVPARPRPCNDSGSHPRSVCRPLPGRTDGVGRLRPVGRRKNEHSSPPSPTCAAAARAA